MTRQRPPHVRLAEPPVVAGRVPPHDLDAEAAVLSACMLSQAGLDEAIEQLKPDHFYSESNARIFEAMVGLAENGQPVDAVTVASWLRDRDRLAAVGGPAYIAQLLDAVPAVGHVAAHAEAVRGKALVRRAIAACQMSAAEGYGDVDDVREYLHRVERRVCELSETEQRSELEPIKETLVEAFSRIQAASAAGNRTTGTPTGFQAIDSMTSGLHAGELTIVAGRPGMGKTSWVMNVAVNVAAPLSQDGGEPVPGMGVAVFSLEMPRDQLAVRMICSEARVDLGRIRRGDAQPADWDALTSAASWLSTVPVWVDDGAALTLLELRAKLRRLRSQHARAGGRLGLVVVDYLQLMRATGSAQNREQEVAELSRGLKALAKELEVPVIALSQLSRAVEARADKRPQLSDLRESGAIEQDADNVLFLYRDEYYNRESEAKGMAEVIIAKQRNGPTGSAMLRFDARCTRFDPLGAA